jgi:hypothetical protein
MFAAGPPLHSERRRATSYSFVPCTTRVATPGAKSLSARYAEVRVPGTATVMSRTARGSSASRATSSGP